MFFFALILFAVPAVFYLVLILIPESRESLSIYFFDRLLRRVADVPTADTRFETLFRLLAELIPVFIFCALAILFTRRSKIKSNLLENANTALLFIAIGLSGTIPLMLTMVQKGWYMVPAFPYFAIGFAALICPSISSAIERIDYKGAKYKYFKVFGLVVFACCILGISMQIGKVSRDPDLISDVHKIGNNCEKFSVLTVPPEMYKQYDFVLQGYLVRYFNISIESIW